MSRRSATTVTLSIRVPIPPGRKPKPIVDFIRIAIKNIPELGSFKEQITVSVSKRETVYL